MALDGAGNVYIANSTGDPVRVSAVSGVQTTVGTGFDTPAAMAVDAYGNLYIADSGNNSVVMLPVDGSAQTTVGTGLARRREWRSIASETSISPIPATIA